MTYSHNVPLGYQIWDNFNFSMLNPHCQLFKYGPHLIKWVLECLWGNNTDKEGTKREGRQRSGIFIRVIFGLDARRVRSTCIWRLSLCKNLALHSLSGLHMNTTKGYSIWDPEGVTGKIHLPQPNLRTHPNIFFSIPPPQDLKWNSPIMDWVCYAKPNPCNHKCFLNISRY